MSDSDVLGKDKLQHFAVCLVASFLSTELAAGLALGKEYGDRNAVGNHWCWWDILADSLGIIVGTTARVLIIGRWNWY